MTPADRWLATIWPFVRAHLPEAPASVVGIGCGPLEGFVPMLRSHGYDAIGIDPEAPAGPHYLRARRASSGRRRIRLADTSSADEQVAIDAGEIQAARIDWVGHSRRRRRPLSSASVG